MFCARIISFVKVMGEMEMPPKQKKLETPVSADTLMGFFLSFVSDWAFSIGFRFL